ncbi:MAG: hypothetical protein RLY43_1437 [Bacteroidota bacterium]
MKWFKHDSNALTDAKIEKLIAKHSILGYGIYFAIVEIIAQRLESNNPKLEMEHDTELLSFKFHTAEEKINEVINTLINLNLLQKTENGIACYKLINRLDNTLSQNIEIRKLLANFQENNKINKLLCNNNKEIKEIEKQNTEMKDKNMLSSEDILKTDALCVITYFQEVCKLKQFKSTPERIKVVSTCLKKGRTIDDIKKAILNFSHDTWGDRQKYMDLVYAIGVRNKIDNFEKWFNEDTVAKNKKW